MIGLDTNLLVRYLTRDDAPQYAKAKALIDKTTARGDGFVINTVVLCEVAWVLRAAYGYSRDEITDALEQILTTEQFVIENGDEARQAVADCRATNAGFADAFIGRINRTLGAEHTATFDRDLVSLETFHVLA